MPAINDDKQNKNCLYAKSRQQNQSNALNQEPVRQKNRDLDRWRSSIRMPFEGVFSKQRKRAKYRGKVKVLMQCFLEAMCHNLKKAVRILPEEAMPIPISA